jgi:hypothetical protein
MAVNMFRAVFFCVMFSVGLTKKVCVTNSGTVGGGLCDGMPFSWNTCSSVEYNGDQGVIPAGGAIQNAANCAAAINALCATMGGTANTTFCAAVASSGICKRYAADLGTMFPGCSNDADCAIDRAPAVRCCADLKTELGQMCTGIKDLDALVIF